MSYEYIAKTNSPVQNASHLISQILNGSNLVQIVQVTEFTVNAMFTRDVKTESSWTVDLQIVISKDAIIVAIHSSTQRERGELIQLLQTGFNDNGYDLTFEEE